MEKVQLQLLGTPVVSYAGRTATFRSRRALALLIYLAIERRFHTRDQLATLLWPDREQPHSRMLLRSAIALLRNGLHAVGFDSECVLVLEKDRLRLNHDMVDLDLDMLEDAKQPLERSIGGDMPKNASARLGAAIGAYRGDFLGGFTLDDAPTFDEWVTVQREHCHWQMHQVFDQLTFEYNQQRDWRTALHVASRWVEHDSLHEPAYARLIECHLEAGDRAAALRAFERCRAVLERELSIAPGSEIAALVTPPSRAASAAPLPPAPRLPATQAVATDDLQQLQSAYRNMQAGQDSVVVVKQTHVAKVSLVEFTDWLKQQHADWMYGRAYDLGGRVPYQVLIDALRDRIEQERAPNDLLPDVWLAELSRLLPDLRDRYPDLAMPVADTTTQSIHLYEAVFRLTSALAQRSPLIWIVEDMQYADGASLDLLHYLVRRWDADSVPALLVATTDTTVHTGVEHRAPAITRWIAQLSRGLPVTMFTSLGVPLTHIQQVYRVLAA